MDRIDKTMFLKRMGLVLYDSAAVFAAGWFALLLRYEFETEEIPAECKQVVWKMLPFSVLTTILIFTAFRLYKSLWAYAGITEMVNIAIACMAEGTVNYILLKALNKDIPFPVPRSYYSFYMIILAVLVFADRYAYRGFHLLYAKRGHSACPKRVLLIGAGAAADMLLREIKSSGYVHKKVAGIIDDDPHKTGNYLHGVKIIGNRDMIVQAAREMKIDEIMIALPSASASQIKEIIDICKKTGCDLKKLPGIYQLVNGEVSISKLRDIDISDLLGRDPVRVDLHSIMGYVSGKVVMVTGGGGSIGSELCRQIAAHHPRQLILVDIYENTTYEIQNELRHKFPNLDLVVLIASVRNTKRMDWIFSAYRPQIVYHAAAHKHVPLMEDSPNEAVKNNVLGTWKVVQASDRWHVSRFVMISTDKAVNPTNIMGASKRICEMIIQMYDRRSQTEFVAVRFGNVLGSNGSVIPLFRKQIAEGGPVTITHPDIIRYFMTIPEAVSIVLQAGAYAKGGEIFVLDMGEPVKILDLAENLIRLSGYKPYTDIKIKFVGLRPGEKLYEEMLLKEEGMQDTPNQLIHIGKPIEMNEEQFMKQLEKLRDYVVKEPDDIRQAVREIVPAYTPDANKM